MAGTTTPNGLHCEWCGGPLTGKQRTTCNDEHRSKRWRWLNQVPSRIGEPVEPPPAGSQLWRGPDPRLHGAQPDRHRSNGRRERPTRRKPSGLQVSYRKAVDVVASELLRRRLVDPPTDRSARVVAELWIRDALSDRQRARLEARER